MRGRGAHNGLREDEGEASKLSVKMVLIFVHMERKFTKTKTYTVERENKCVYKLMAPSPY